MKLHPDFKKSAKSCGIENCFSCPGYFFVEANKIISSNFPEGIKAEAKEIKNGVEAKITVKKNVKLKQPLFLCFGLLKEKGEQFVVPEIIIEEGASVKIIAHCSFPHAKEIEHKMEGFFRVKKNASFFYDEYHYHGSKSGASVNPNLKIEVDQGGHCANNFYLVKGTTGKTRINLEANLYDNADFVSKIKALGKGKNDQTDISEKVYLLGRESKSIIKMRAAAKNGGKVLMQGETYAQAAGSQGHVDCQEIVIGQNSVAKAVPIVQVSHEQARVTHEAAVGKINQKELQALMVKGLNEAEATELILNAMLNN